MKVLTGDELNLGAASRRDLKLLRILVAKIGGLERASGLYGMPVAPLLADKFVGCRPTEKSPTEPGNWRKQKRQNIPASITKM